MVNYGPGAQIFHPRAFHHRPRLVVQIVKDLGMIAQKAQGNDQNPLFSPRGQGLDLPFDLRVLDLQVSATEQPSVVCIWARDIIPAMRSVRNVDMEGSVASQWPILFQDHHAVWGEACCKAAQGIDHMGVDKVLEGPLDPYEVEADI